MHQNLLSFVYFFDKIILLSSTLQLVKYLILFSYNLRKAFFFNYTSSLSKFIFSISVCSSTLWVGHLSKLVTEEELSDLFGEFGLVESINLVPPRGCAFIHMNRRQDANRAMKDLHKTKLQGKPMTIAWAPGKGLKEV